MTHRCGLWLAALLLLAARSTAQEPLVAHTPEVRRLLQASQDRNTTLASRRWAVEAARLRTTAVARRGPTTIALEVEELSLGRPIDQTLTLAAERAFIPRAAVDADRDRALALVALQEARLSAASLRNTIDLQRLVLEAAVWQRIRSRLAEEDSVLLRADASLRTRFAAGAARYVDVVRMRTERIRLQSEGAAALANAAAARQRLAVLLRGNATEVNAAIASLHELPTLRLPTPEELWAAAPALRIAAAELAIARADLRLIQTEGARKWTAGGGLQRFQSDNGYTIGPVLTASLTLPQRSLAGARAQAAAADTLAVAYSSVAAATQLQAAAVSARERFEAARQRFDALDPRLLSAAREERVAALTGYATGDLSLTELLEFERALARAELQQLESYLAMIDAWADLWHAAAAAAEEVEQ